MCDSLPERSTGALGLRVGSAARLPSSKQSMGAKVLARRSRGGPSAPSFFQGPSLR